ncbi:MAG: hypothetical protein ACYC0W_06355 [Candidatus Nanopelagicales bacterium]
MCSLIGFCGVTAILGLILGLAGRPQAKRNAAGTGLATAAIVISLLWIVPPLILWFLFGALMATTPSPTTATKPTTVRSAPAVPRCLLRGFMDRPGVPQRRGVDDQSAVEDRCRCRGPPLVLENS